MNPPASGSPVLFLTTLARLFTSVGLYPRGHPTRTEAAEACLTALAPLLEEQSPVVLSFLEDEVIYGERRLEGPGLWPWSPRLYEAGVQRLELRAGIEAEEFDAFGRELAHRLGLIASARPGEREGTAGHPHIVYGRIGVRTRRGEERARPWTGSPLDLTEEAETIRWIHEVSAERDAVPEAETAAIVGAMLIAVRSAREIVAPLLEIQRTDQYTSTHCLNVSILAMTLAEYLGLSDEDILTIGEAGLLHDIGKSRVPPRILNKPGRLEPRERAVIEHHVVEGARILLGSEERNPLCAIVAYEHHMHWRPGGGYPTPAVDHQPHRFSRLVQVCDVFDALRSPRPWRPALAAGAALAFLERRAGSEFDPQATKTLVRMMHEWEPHLVAHDTHRGAAEENDAGALAARVERSASGFDADMEGELYVT